jgi:hypothetical protein
MSVLYLLGLTLRRSELEIRSDIFSKLFFLNQVLPPDVLTRLAIGKYAAGLVHNNNLTTYLKTL